MHSKASHHTNDQFPGSSSSSSAGYHPYTSNHKAFQYPFNNYVPSNSRTELIQKSRAKNITKRRCAIKIQR